MSSNDHIINMPIEDEKQAYVSCRNVSDSPSPDITDPFDAKPTLKRNNTNLQNFLSVPGPENTGEDGEVDALRSLGRCYKRIREFSVVTKYAFYFLPVAVILSIPLIIFATVRKDHNIQGVKTMWLFIWIEISWSALWVAKLIANTLPRIFRMLCGVMSAGTRKHSMIIRALEIPLSIVMWVLISWCTIPVIVCDTSKVTITSSKIRWIYLLQRAFIASIPTSLIYLVEKIIIEFIAVNYHRTQFNAKIQENKRKMHLFELLYEASTALYPKHTTKKFQREDLIINEGLLDALAKDVTNTEYDETTHKILHGVSRVGAGAASMLKSIVNEVTGTAATNTKSAHAIVSWALERKEACEALARRVFQSLVEDGHDALYLKDIKRVLGPESQDESEEVFSGLDRDGNGDVSQSEVEAMVIDLMNSRRSMTRSLHDVDRAIKALDRILLCIVAVGVAVIYATFFSKDFYKTLSVYTTGIMSCSFAFSATVTEFCGSCIFLFAKHPYDVGDRVEINSIDMVVEHISLLYTVFRRIDTNRTVQIPNIVNNGVWIENTTRSKGMKEHISLSISPGTSFENIELLRTELKDFIVADENKRDYSPKFSVEVANVGDLSKLELKINIEYKSSISRDSQRVASRSKFMCALLTAMRKLNIEKP